jgi:hypothetical protein
MYKAAHKMRKLLAESTKSGEELAQAKLFNSLGAGACISCRAAPCHHKPYADLKYIKNRTRVLDDELERVRLEEDRLVFESSVPLSTHVPGGNTHFRRDDLLNELSNEAAELSRQKELTLVDQEFHDVVASQSQYVEVRRLHSYKVIMWTKNARDALAMRQSHLVAINVAEEAVDAILDFMLDGWYFGECDITKVEREGALVQHKHLKKARKPDGTDEMALKLSDVKVARDGNLHERKLDSIEGTLRFGLFTLTLMYFRAVVYVRKHEREKTKLSILAAGASLPAHMLEEDKGSLHDERSLMTEERGQAIAMQNLDKKRQRKIDSIISAVKVGDARRAAREANEKETALLYLQELLQRQKLEKENIVNLQRIYRGHLARKAAKRWLLKKTEMESVNALLVARYLIFHIFICC